MPAMASDRKRTALFPGTFDPLTNGHLDVIRRAAPLFDHVIVAIGTNPAKQDLFTLDERAAIIRDVLHDEGIDSTVKTFRGLTVDFARRSGAAVIVRGLRNSTDLAFEFQLAITNRAVADIETVFIVSGEPYGFTSSSLIKQIAAAGDIDRLSRLLPPRVITAMKKKTTRLKKLARQSDAMKQ
jgi:pantetheine-phosphate adenylyltransferase